MEQDQLEVNLYLPVVSIIEDPIRGWIDNMNGPVGMLVAGAKGE